MAFKRVSVGSFQWCFTFIWTAWTNLALKNAHITCRMSYLNINSILRVWGCGSLFLLICLKFFLQIEWNSCTLLQVAYLMFMRKFWHPLILSKHRLPQVGKNECPLMQTSRILWWSWICNLTPICYKICIFCWIFLWGKGNMNEADKKEKNITMNNNCYVTN